MVWVGTYSKMKICVRLVIVTVLSINIAYISQFGGVSYADAGNSHELDDDDEDSINALVTVETENDNTGEIITKFDGAFGKDVYDPDLPEFKPTREWQTVRNGQAIPRGLHVRLNLETGDKEAKLLPEDDGLRFENVQTKKTAYSGQGHPSRLQGMKDAVEQAVNDLEAARSDDGLQYWKEGEKHGMANMNKNTFSRDELKSALKKFKATDDNVQSPDKPKENFYRTIEDIKSDFKELKMEMKTDLEIIQELLSRYKDPKLSTQHRINILTDFEYYLHQIDNALNFAQMGGLEMVISDLNHTQEAVRSEAAIVVGSAAQSNPTVQISAIESGAMQQLIRMLSTESAIQVRQRIVYALSSLIRNLPHAQKLFIQMGGIQSLSDLFSQHGSEQLQMKAITLVTDILEEINTHTYGNDLTEAQSKRVEHYKEVHLEQILIEQGWCDLVPKLLLTSEHDSRERVLNAMTVLVNSCKNTFVEFNDTLSQLEAEYSIQSMDESDDDDKYYSKMLKTIQVLLKDLNRTMKEEL